MGRPEPKKIDEGNAVTTSNPTPQPVQCPFCRQVVPPAQVVCLSCGAQQRVIEIEGSALLCMLAVIAFTAVTVISVCYSPYGAGLAGWVPTMLGAPEWVTITAALFGWLAMLVFVPIMAWKVFLGSWNKLTRRRLVWSRGGAIAPMGPLS